MIESEELNRFHCVGSEGRPLVVLHYQLFETVDTGRGMRRRPGVIRMELESGEAVRQIDATCFEIVNTGELLTIDPDVVGPKEQAEGASSIPLCHHKELVERENRLRQREEAKQT